MRGLGSEPLGTPASQMLLGFQFQSPPGTESISDAEMLEVASVLIGLGD
jgi:hypothetical protein